MKSCKRCLISGRVQGVFFRHAARQQAITLDVQGWVRNLPNGDVECVVSGDAKAVELLCTWLKQGPLTAQVTALQIEDLPWQEHHDFVILR